MFISLILNPFRGLPGPSAGRHSSGNRGLSWPFARYRHSSFRCCSTPDAVRGLVAEGWLITADQLGAMSPYLRAHISRFGAYATDDLTRRPEAFNPVLKEVDFTAPALSA